jgi:hypothetical protein
MRRSTLNRVFFALLYGAVPLQIVTIAFEQWSIWYVLVVPAFYLLMYGDDYIYEKRGQFYFRSVPFFKGVPIQQLRELKDLRVVDTAINVHRLWRRIQHLRSKS